MSDFARRVNEIARAQGVRRVPIVRVWFEIGEPHWDRFQTNLLRAMRDGEVELARADLRQGTPEEIEEIEDSRVIHPMTGAEYNYIIVPRQNPAPKDIDPAAELYEGFHQYDVDEVVPFDPKMTMPRFCTKAGKALHVLYRSTKIDPETGKPPRGGAQNYIHEHDAGVAIYEPCARGDEDAVAVPKMLLEIDTLVYLGQCLGVGFDDGEGEYEIDWSRGVDLFAIPSGKALVIVRGKREILCLVWGGGLGVEPRGIVG